MSKNKILNLLGQLRFYSIADIILLLFAIRADISSFVGVIFLHLGFILYLEYRHNHFYRDSFPKYLWVILSIIGIFFYSKLAVIGFFATSFLYAEKKYLKFGYLAPLFRGLQLFFLIGGIIGFDSNIIFLITGLIILRNLAGDFRDITKDKKDGMKTFPIILGFKRNIKHIHLISLLLTSLVWWYLAEINILWLLLVYIIQLTTYYLTPR